MGNTQSAEAPRRPPTKLTKPRTNTSTSNLLAISSAPSRRSSTLSLPVARIKRSSTLSLVEVPADEENGAVKSKTASRARRRSLFRSKSAQPETTLPTEEPTSDVETTMAFNPLHRYSSMVSVRVDMMGDIHNGVNNVRPPVRTSQSALAYFPQASQPSRLSLVIEAQSPEPDPQEELRQLGSRHGSFNSEVQESPMSPPDRSSTPDSIPIPIRRRSLLTPGIATRKPSREKIVRKSLPAQPSRTLSERTEPSSAKEKRNFRRTLPAPSTNPEDHLRQYSYDQIKPNSSPLEEIATLEAKHFRDVQPRTVTPSDLDYGHIGAYKLGSLRITNGTVSPAPSGPEPSYFDSKLQANVDEVEPIPTSLVPRKVGVSLGEYYNESTGTSVSTKQSQVRFEFHEVSDLPPKIVQTMVDIPTFSLDLSEFQVESSAQEITVVQSPTTACEMAQAYMQEIAASPFSFEESPPPSPRLEATSKRTEMEDNLFDDEPGSVVSLTSPVPQQPVLKYSQRSVETQTSFTSLVAPVIKPGIPQQSLRKMLQGQSEHPLKPLEKADSGYSSKTSLRSLRSRRSSTEAVNPTEISILPILALGAPAVPNKSPPPTPPKNLYARQSSERSIVASTVQGSKSPDTEYAPATPAKDWSSRSSYGLGEALYTPQVSPQAEFQMNDAVSRPPLRQTPAVPNQQAASTWAGWSGPPPLPIKSIEQTQAAVNLSSEVLSILEKPTPTRRLSNPLLPYGQTMRPGLKPSASDTSISTTSRKLYKRTPVAQPGLIVQGFMEIEPDSVPPVSQEVSEHLEERLRNFPTLTHTYKSVHRTNSKETLATIFSMASAEQQAEDAQMLSRYQDLIPNVPSNEDIERSVIVEPSRSIPTHAQRFSLMPKILRRSAERRSRRQSLEPVNRIRSSSREPEDQDIYIADLSSLSLSLDSSPYQLATNALIATSGNRIHELPFVAKHERDFPRGRTIGMDSESAAQFARERSRSRENERRHAIQRESYENWNSSEELYLPQDLRSKSATESGPPVPNITLEKTRDSIMPKKTKSPPPVSMKMPRKRLSSPPPKPDRAAPSTPIDIPQLPKIQPQQNQAKIENKGQSIAWQKQQDSWHDRKQSAQDALTNARQSIGSMQPNNNRPSLEQQRHTSTNVSNQSTGEQVSFYQQSYSLQNKQQGHSLSSSLQDRRDVSVRQSYNSTQSWKDGKALARASFDSSIGPNIRNGHPLSQSQSYTQMRSDKLTVDRYSGGLAYGYEPGYGIGGSAGTRSGDTAASRKGVPGSQLWGIDFSDVPIIVKQT